MGSTCLLFLLTAGLTSDFVVRLSASSASDQRCTNCTPYNVAPSPNGDIYLMFVYPGHESKHSASMKPPGNFKFNASRYGPDTPPEWSGDCSNQAILSWLLLKTQFTRIIDQLNKDTSILGGLKLGQLAVDDCRFTPLASNLALMIASMRTPNAKLFASKFPVFPQIPPAIMIGALESETSAALTRYSEMFNLPQIDYGATAAALSDRHQYPLYARTVPSDVDQATAISDLLTSIGANCVHLVFSNGIYGESGITELQIKLRKNGIKTAAMTRISMFTDASFQDLHLSADTPSQEIVIVCFCDRWVLLKVASLLGQKRSSSSSQKYLVVASDLWDGGTEQPLPEFADSIELITASLSGPKDKDLSKATVLQILAERNSDYSELFIWLATDPSAPGKVDNIPISRYLLPVKQATLAAVYGLKAFLEANCPFSGTGMSLKERCKDRLPSLLLQGHAIYEFIRSSSFEISLNNSKTNFSFNSNAEIDGQYEFSYRRNKTAFTLGQWTKQGGFVPSSSDRLKRILADWSILLQSCSTSPGCDEEVLPYIAAPTLPCREVNSISTENKTCRNECSADIRALLMVSIQNNDENKRRMEVAAIVIGVVLGCVAIALLIVVILFAASNKKLGAKTQELGRRIQVMQELPPTDSHLQPGLEASTLNEYFARKEAFVVKPTFDIDKIHRSLEEYGADHKFIEDVIAHLVPRDSLTISNAALAEGFFGVVYPGLLKTSPNSEEETKAAIKVLKSDKAIDILEFLDEGLLMANFHHENVVELHGLAFHSNWPVLVVPYMERGNLQQFLARHLRGEVKLPESQLLRFGLQICSGMVYLASKKFIHRDLACRNVLLDENNVAKIADFGLSRQLFQNDYYKPVHVNRPLPVRWHPPESIEGRKFGEKSDVWSFGVTLWEIFSYGRMPYYGKSDATACDFIMRGEVLQKPENCADKIYNVMLSCWKMEISDRPAFPELHEKLSDIS